MSPVFAIVRVEVTAWSWRIISYRAPFKQLTKADGNKTSD